MKRNSIIYFAYAKMLKKQLAGVAICYSQLVMRKPMKRHGIISTVLTNYFFVIMLTFCTCFLLNSLLTKMLYSYFGLRIKPLLIPFVGHLNLDACPVYSDGGFT